MNIRNHMKLSFDAVSANEGFSRAVICAFILPLNPTVAEVADVKTAVSEAVTNAIVHAYPHEPGTVYIDAKITDDNRVIIRIRDTGVGIENIEQAMEPLYTTSADERAGLGFAVMQSFSDKVRVRSTVGKGTTVTLVKIIRSAHDEE